jgi:hypothetical protein
VDLCRNGALPGAVFAKYQERAIAFGNTLNRALEPSLRKKGWFRLPIPIVNHCNCRHKETNVHFIFKNTDSRPAGRVGEQNKG